jgi:L-aspartate oxidase
MMRTDVVVVGSGIAGLFFALKVAKYGTVTLVTKKSRPESSTNWAQGGVAAVFGADDSVDLHVEDTLVAGAGLCHPDAVNVLVREGPLRVRELIELGVRFTQEGEDLSLGREGGHSRRRIVRAADLTGREIERGLLHAVAESPNITILENHAAVDLLTATDPGTLGERCCGVLVLDTEAGELKPFLARAVMLATGGCGQVYRHTTNPSIATGDGVAMAYRAGAKVANMEFVQFHPTALYPARDRTFLISEAVRGEGAVLRRRDGTAFMDGYHPLASLAPRDVVARAIDTEMKRSGDPS